MSIFHAYDIRGVYGEDLDEGIAYRIGRAVVTHLKAETVLVGRDMRTSSPKLQEALINGITDQGANVVSIGLCSTPMFYWATQQYTAGVMVTASHNPAKYNGFKVCKDGAVPVGGTSGLKEIEALVMEDSFPLAERKGSVCEKKVLLDFVTFGRSFLRTDRPFRIVVDAANGMGGYTYKALEKVLPDQVTIVPLYFRLDGRFPNHEANPLKVATLQALQERVLSEGADFGVALDGDGDRVAFVDEKGGTIASDTTTALIARQVLQERPGRTILYDIRSSRVVPEEVETAGGVPVMTRVGHAFIKLDMIRHDGAFGGEVSGHYYNPEQQNTENTMIVLFRLMNLIAAEERPLSEILRPLRRYAKIPETNFSVGEKQAIIARMRDEYGSQEGAVTSELDGVRVDFPDWWFNVRASNTEPLLRLNMEAKTQALLRERLRELSEKIRS